MNRIISIISCLLVAVSAFAQTAPVTEMTDDGSKQTIVVPSDGVREATGSDSLEVAIVTFYPGSEVHQLFGHTEIRVYEKNVDGFDAYFNYGMFDFSSDNFIYRFVAGQTDYKVVALPPFYAMQENPGRRKVQQVLNLTQDQARQIRDYLIRNSMPDSCTYRYKFISDNCATRPRDIVARALGGELKYGPASEGRTAREIMQYYNRNYPWEQFGIDLALGVGIDTVLSQQAAMFVPIILERELSAASVTRNGKTEPLVTESDVLVEGSEDGLALPPTPWYKSPLAVALLVLLLVAIKSWRDVRRGCAGRLTDTLVFGIYALAGCLIWFLVFVSTHESTSPNWNAVWLHPLYLLPAVLVWIKSGKKLLVCLHYINFVVLLLLMLCWPLLGQTANVAFWPLMLVPALRSLTHIAIARKDKKKTV